MPPNMKIFVGIFLMLPILARVSAQANLEELEASLRGIQKELEAEASKTGLSSDMLQTRRTGRKKVTADTSPTVPQILFPNTQKDKALAHKIKQAFINSLTKFKTWLETLPAKIREFKESDLYKHLRIISGRILAFSQEVINNIIRKIHSFDHNAPNSLKTNYFKIKKYILQKLRELKEYIDTLLKDAWGSKPTELPPQEWGYERHKDVENI